MYLDRRKIGMAFGILIILAGIVLLNIGTEVFGYDNLMMYLSILLVIAGLVFIIKSWGLGTGVQIEEPSESVKVLAIDDEADIRRLIQIKLSKEGYRVTTAADGIEGVRKAVQIMPDVMIVDVMMPGKDGYEVVRDVRKKLRTNPPVIIMLTAKSEDSDMIKGISSGADDYITKPFSPRELIERINVALIKGSSSSQ